MRKAIKPEETRISPEQGSMAFSPRALAPMWPASFILEGDLPLPLLFPTVPTETTYHTLEEGVVEYCTAEAPPPLPAEAPVEMMAQHADPSVKPQALKSRIALNSAKLIQEQRVTNLHVKEIAQHLEQQNDLLQMIRRSQEVQACAQERQAQAMEGTQAALSVLIQVLRPMIKDFRRYLQSNTPNPTPPSEAGQVAQNGQPDSIIQ